MNIFRRYLGRSIADKSLVKTPIKGDESICSVKEHFARIHDELKYLDERLKVEALGKAVKDSFAKKVDWR